MSVQSITTRLCRGCGVSIEDRAPMAKFCVTCRPTTWRDKPSLSPKPCAHCGAPFTPAVTKSRYCSQRCGGLARTDSDAPVDLPPTTCVWCGVVFYDRKTRRYCSRPCANKGWRKQETRTCPTCFRPFSVTPWMKKVYCRPKCVQARPSAIYFLTCEGCQTLFTSRTDNQKFCSRVCHLSKKMTYGDTYHCRTCGALVTYTKAKAYWRPYCHVHYNDVLAFRQRRRRHSRRNGNAPDNIKSILVRIQGGQCVYCKRNFTPELPAHLDHIVPIKRGGSDDQNNFQALCAPCNWSKNDRDPIEYAQTEHGMLF